MIAVTVFKLLSQAVEMLFRNKRRTIFHFKHNFLQCTTHSEQNEVGNEPLVRLFITQLIFLARLITFPFSSLLNVRFLIIHSIHLLKVV